MIGEVVVIVVGEMSEWVFVSSFIEDLILIGFDCFVLVMVSVGR